MCGAGSVLEHTHVATRTLLIREAAKLVRQAIESIPLQVGDLHVNVPGCKRGDKLCEAVWQRHGAKETQTAAHRWQRTLLCI